MGREARKRDVGPATLRGRSEGRAGGTPSSTFTSTFPACWTRRPRDLSPEAQDAIGAIVEDLDQPIKDCGSPLLSRRGKVGADRRASRVRALWTGPGISERLVPWWR